MKKNGPKIGRSAHELLRDQAAALVRAYRPVLDSPDGRYCSNPDDAPEEQTWVTVPQALNAVLIALGNFEKTGSFAPEIDFKRLHIRETYRAMKRAGIKREDAIEELMTIFPQSRSTIVRAIREDKAKARATAERLANIPEILRVAIEAWAKRKKVE